MERTRVRRRPEFDATKTYWSASTVTATSTNADTDTSSEFSVDDGSATNGLSYPPMDDASTSSSPRSASDEAGSKLKPRWDALPSDELPSLHAHFSASSSGGIDKMRCAIISAAVNSSQVLRREALRADRDPRKRLRNVRHLKSSNGISLYERQQSRHTTRVMGVTQLHTPIHDLVAVLSPKSPLSFPLLNPGIADYDTMHILVDEPTQYVAIKSMVMHAQWVSPQLSHTHTFVVIEYHQAISTDDGRRGWAVSFHSLSWPGCPDPQLGAVRGSIYNTGVVVVERARKSETIDVFYGAELKLKGAASRQLDAAAAKERVFDSLVLLTGTIEQRAVSELEVIQTSDFREIDRNTMLVECSICAENKRQHSGERSVRSDVPMFRCRKCCVSVCADCSTTWRRGQKEMRLCIHCWGDTTLQF